MRPCFFTAFGFPCRMARLRENRETGRLFIEIPRGKTFSNHNLNVFGESRVRKARLPIDSKVPFFFLQLLDQNDEAFPPCGAFKGQLQFDGFGFLAVAIVTRRSSARPPDTIEIIPNRQMELL
jgi:hypothetical protein